MSPGTGQPPHPWASCSSASLPLLYKKCFPYIQSKSPLFQSETISPCLITIDPAKESVPFLLTAPLQVLKGCYQVSLGPSLLQSKQPQPSACSLTGEVFHPLDHFRGPPLDAHQWVHISPVLRTLHPDTVLQVRSHQCRGAGSLNLRPRFIGTTYQYTQEHIFRGSNSDTEKIFFFLFYRKGMCLLGQTDSSTCNYMKQRVAQISKHTQSRNCLYWYIKQSYFVPYFSDGSSAEAGTAGRSCRR